MRSFFAALATSFMVAGCAGSAGLTTDYSKNERLQVLLDATTMERDAERGQLKAAETEGERVRITRLIMSHNVRIRDIKGEMGYPLGAVEPVLPSSNLARAESGAALNNPETVTANFNSVRRDTSEFTKFVKLQAPSETSQTGFGSRKEWTPSALISKQTGEISYYIHYYEIYSASTWKFLSLASTDSSDYLKVTRLNSNVISCRGGCTYSEEVSIDLPPSLIAQSLEKPLRIQIQGKNADRYVFAINQKVLKDLSAQAAAESEIYKGVATAAPALAPAPRPGINSSMADELQKLAKLKADGVITDKEFEALKSKLIAK